MRHSGSNYTLLVIVVAFFCATQLSAGRAAEVRTESFTLINQGVTAYKNGDFPIAIEKLQRAASMALNNFRAHYYLGLSLVGDRRYTDALDILEIALDLDPDHLQSLVAVGDAYVKLGDLDEANAAYFRALKFRPEYPAALDGLARIAESRGDDAGATDFFRRAIASNRGYAPAYTHLGDLYLRLDKFQEAVELLEEAVSVRPDFAAGMNRLALAYGRLGLTNKAIAAIQRALEIEPNNAAHPATLGQLQLEQGSLRAAEASFDRALKLDDGQPRALWGMAEVARRRGNYPLALQYVDTALADSRTDAMISARFLEYRVEVEQEQQNVERLIQLVEGEEATHADYAALALIYAERNLWHDAIEMQANVESSIEQRSMMAFMLFRANRFREAHEIYSALLQETGAAETAINNGVTLAWLGDDPGAIKMYRRALDVEPGNLNATLFLGNALLREGEHNAAVTHYREFLDRSDPGERTERVRRILEQIAPEVLNQAPDGPPMPGRLTTTDGSDGEAS